MLENFGIPKGSGIKPKSINERMMGNIDYRRFFCWKRPFAQPKLIRKQSESQVTAKTSVNTAKNSENRKKSQHFLINFLSPRRATTMDIKATESESQDTAVVTQPEGYGH
ncbi:hypothetical protein JCM33374_g3383 [Metschnikowia sp. JCM 33374]|nr:hypothetical protein JCM33374_g3383 [Metschnikowia sp. JCM 33374]